MGVLSVWQRSTRDDPLVNMGKDEDLPVEADKLVRRVRAPLAETLDTAAQMRIEVSQRLLGSIASKTLWRFFSQNVLSTSCKRKIIACIAPVWKLISLRLLAFRVDAFVKEHNVECEWTTRQTLDVCLSEEFKAYSNIAYDNVLKRGGAKEVTVHSEEAASSLHETLINNVDDSAPMDEITVNAFTTFSKLFPQAGYNASGMQPGQIGDKDSSYDSGKPDYKGFEYAWSGIIGMILYRSLEKFLAKLANSLALASMDMARIFLCAPALAKIVMGERFEATGIPKAFAITEERMQRLKDMLSEASVAPPRIEKAADITLSELQEPLAKIRLSNLAATTEQKRVPVPV
ncbi:hypothetical protein QFC19_001487 [Naganishia cerealis]|uniref:Uncharacterized protein n=1 Tax=Naganishia cerealis TaxID=610337 RepID=A0ACC2WGY3_9TREE|nr:hypothetical protein QFC19_001487 [Naganishia cerealis]